MKNQILLGIAVALISGLMSIAANADPANNPSYSPVLARAAALYAEGMNYFNGGNGVQADWAVAFQKYVAAAHLGDKDAMLQLAYMYKYAQGVPQDQEMSSYWSHRDDRF